MRLSIFFLIVLIAELPLIFTISVTRVAYVRLDQVDLAVTYSWQAPRTNLDTNTHFRTDYGGAGCSNTREYVEWAGDSTGTGGSETAVVLLAKAKRLNPGSKLFVVQLNAAYDPGNIGPAKVRVALRRIGSTIEVSPALTIGINAGTKRGGCASSPVAIIIIQQIATRVRVKVSNDDLAHPTPRPVNYLASVWQDPHFTTFDNYYSHCQGKGEFILTKTDGLEIQGRFGGQYKRVTLPVGFAVKHGNLPRVQVTVVKDPTNEFGIPDTSKYTPYGTRCHYLFMVGNQKRLLSAGTGNSEIDLWSRFPFYRITFRSTQISIQFRMAEVASQCKTESLRIILPSSFTIGKRFFGLLGTPNGDISDDIMAADGSPIHRFIPNEKGRYNYCRANWCLPDGTNSLFYYEGSTGHNTHHECDKPFEDILGRQLDIRNCGDGVPCIHASVAQSAENRDALRQIRKTCGVNEACLFEGMSMVREENASVALQATNDYLQTEAEDSRDRAEQSSFSFSPSTLLARQTVSVRVVLDVDGGDTSIARYALYRLNVAQGRKDGPRLAYLVKLSSSENTYVADVSIRTESVGQRLSFRAIPVISGSESTTASLLKDAINVISSYQVVPAPFGAPATTSPNPQPTDDITVSRSSLENVQLIVRYSWSNEIEDLDTATRFINETGGHLCSPFGEYVNFFGNVETRAGNEFSIVRIGKAEKDGVWTRQTRVEFYAGVRGDEPHPASLRISLLDVTTRETIEGSTVLESIAPGTATGCADTLVATLNIAKKNGKYTFNIDVD